MASWGNILCGVSEIMLSTPQCVGYSVATTNEGDAQERFLTLISSVARLQQARTTRQSCEIATM